jgi:hypothetical protein
VRGPAVALANADGGVMFNARTDVRLLTAEAGRLRPGSFENIGAAVSRCPVSFHRASNPRVAGSPPQGERQANSQLIGEIPSLVLRVALCGTFSERSVVAGSQLTRIRSKSHVLRRRALALPKTLNLLVEGSIRFGLTTKPNKTSRSLQTESLAALL